MQFFTKETKHPTTTPLWSSSTSIFLAHQQNVLDTSISEIHFLSNFPTHS